MKNKPTYNENPLTHFSDGVYTKQEAKEALELLRDRENNTITNEHMAKDWDQIPAESDRDTFEYSRDFEQAKKLLKQINKPPFFKKYLKYAAVAASVALFISIGILGSKYFHRHTGSQILYTEISTGYGETKEVTLPDGTATILNACTRLSYPERFTADERQVALEGEAYFRVTKNEEQPFVIHTGNFNVQVLGTAFNVRAYIGDQIQSVNVESGKVQIDMPDAMSRLSRNEQIVINTTTSDYNKTRMENQDVAVWRQGGLHFYKAPIEDVANQLERIYGCRIIFEKGRQFNNLITGEHDNRSLGEVLESIRMTTGIKWKAGSHPNEIILYK